MNYSRIPILKKYYSKYSLLKQKIETLERENIFLSRELQRKNHLEKWRMNKKINLVFVCHRPQVWNSLKSIFEHCIADESFNITIVAVPIKKQLPEIGFNHELYESEGAEDFWKDFPCCVINGYNYETKEWFDLTKLKPDYVFFQQPYNAVRCEAYKSNNVARYATICHVNYYYDSCKELGFQCIPPDFVNNVSLYFMQNKTEKEWIEEYLARINNNFTKLYVSGFPRFDLLNSKNNENCNVWKRNNPSDFRIIWTPRWTTNENNCHFFKYKDLLLDYCKKHLNLDFVFRPHPQAFLNWVANKEISEKQLDIYREKYNQMDNAVIDRSQDYLPLFYTSSCIVTDFSSVVPEYFLTGKPVVYCYNEKSLYNNEGKFTEGFYYVKNWKELEDTLNMLRKGIDPLKDKRKELIKSEFFVNKEGAGFSVKEILKRDFSGGLL